MDDIISRENIRLRIEVSNWRQAITAAGELLVASQYSFPSYTAEMIGAVETLGPYIVVAPGIAFAHSRPGPAVIRTGISMVTLAQPVCFGNEENDPVQIVFALCATDKNNHIHLLARLVSYLDNEENLPFLKQCDDAEQVYRAINHAIPGE
ncbi:PTS sugar transporter subunit IIA [Erwinia amylovora]